MKRIKFISLDQLLEMKTNHDDFMIVDVLSPEKFQEGHLPGAINIPVDQIEKEAEIRINEKAAVVVVYCGGYSCTASTTATRKLLDLGYKHTVDFKGDKKAWKDAGLDLGIGQ
jgi:rhodanese-related sulfurtransferase